MEMKLSPKGLITQVEAEFNICLTMKNRHSLVVDIRAIVAALLYEQGCTTSTVGRMMGGYERSTVSYWLRIAEERYQCKDEWVLRYWRRIMALIPQDVELELPWYVLKKPEFIQSELQES